MLPKYFSEDYLSGRKTNNISQRDTYYVHDRCATRFEKGREACKESPTVREEKIKEELGQRICGDEFGEEAIRKKISRVQVEKDGQMKILFRD